MTPARRSTGGKRRIAVDTLGLLSYVLVTAASVREHDGAKPLLELLGASLATTEPWSAGA